MNPAYPQPATGRCVVVTGGSRGIGAAVALGAARAGFDVAVGYREDSASAAAIAAAARAMGRRSLALGVDVSREGDVLAFFGAIDEALGTPYALVNSAGIVDIKSRVDEMGADRMARMLAVNVLGTMLCAREAVRRMSTRHPSGRGGVIVNLSSRASTLGSPHQYVDYAASKGAVDTFTIGLSREVAAEGVRVNAVRPGIIDTDIHANAGNPERVREAGALIPMQRAGRADEVAAAVLWLMSDAASYATGALLDVAGGR